MAGTTAGAAKARAARAGAATPTDRKAPARKAVVRKPTAAEIEQMPAAQVETLGEAGANDDGSIDFTYDGETFHVHSPADWRQSAMTGLRDFDFNTWARGAMDTDDADRFVAADLTMREADEFLDGFYVAFEARYGADPKALRTQLGSSRSTRRS